MTGLAPGRRRRWQPVLDGAAADAARAAVDEIAAGIDVDPDAPGSPGPSRGASGYALLYAYLDQAYPDAGHRERAERWLDRAIELIGSQATEPSLHSGFVGVAWTLEHLDGDEGGDDDDLAVDQALAGYLDGRPWTDHYDLIDGLVGIGVYAVERLPRSIAADNLARVIARLGEVAEPRDGGLTWRSRPELMIPRTRAAHPRGYHDLGVAHGVPGVAVIAAAAAAAGVAGEDAERLLAGAWRWIMASRLAADAETTFPHWISEAEPPRPARSAWCYGDPGAAAALFAAARLAGDRAGEDVALDIARRAAGRPVDRCGCVDAGLCHGTTGLALIYTRLWQESGDPRFADAARQWFGETLARRRPGRGIAGFQAYHPHPDGSPPAWEDDPTFLTGAAGVALGLLAGISSVEPAWDRLLAISLPPAGPP